MLYEAYASTTKMTRFIEILGEKAAKRVLWDNTRVFYHMNSGKIQ
ncbi:Uncharacterised protein [Candidatus Venteria ishoeyi]|uniref:Uncharacterized protein n=1 Tax=Candidatus Venteria ishoeyi TaxID=1899563 RepID=A0A1H6F470_9GAMM|nr:Uncharacterised protein [Candidatus Venteria ishoeyi]